MRASWVEINLGAIRKNILYLKSKINPSTKFMGVIKADAYGHGAIPVAKIMKEEGVDYFAVALIQEGIELRENGFSEPILILGHVFKQDFPLIHKYVLTLTVSSLEQAKELSEFGKNTNVSINIHVKIDTGMGRLGFLVDEYTLEQIEEITKLPNIYVEGIYSHLATAPQIEDISYCQRQFQIFKTLLNQLDERGIKISHHHISNSGATILFPEMQLDMVRPGTAIYGLYPGPELEDIVDIQLYPAMEIKSKLANVKTVSAGTKISYSGSFETTQKTTLGVVPLGYVDGIFRNLANIGEVLVQGKRCRMVGNVCMDQFVINLSGIDSPQIGNEVVILGSQGEEFISAEELGEKAGTISIEILCGLGKRMPMVFLPE